MIFVPYEFPKSLDGSWIAVQEDHRILFTRREMLGLTQQQVADIAQVQLRQIQRLEAGTSSLSSLPMKTGLAICAALLLDPYEMIPLFMEQPDPSSLKPTPSFDFHANLPKRKGRKPIQRDVMSLFFNLPGYSIAIPTFVLDKLGKPDFIQFLWHSEKKQFLFRAAAPNDEHTFKVASCVYENAITFALPESDAFDQFISSLKWSNGAYEAESRIVQDGEGTEFIFCDLKTAKPSEGISGPFVSPFDN